jgi:hypothetical protein
MFGWRKAAFALSLALSVSGCVTPEIDPDDPGHVSGYLMVFWDREDHFIYYPLYKTDPLKFRLPKRLAAELGVDYIQPGIIYTDGGSIPQAVRGWTGFSPWGYGPAYIVHDWLFIAHHCIVNNHIERHDKRDLDEVEKVRKVDFKLSADLLAAVIQALVLQNKVPKRDFAPKAIYTAVDSSIAKRLWDSKDPNSCRPPDPEVVRQIEERLNLGARIAAVPPATGEGPVLIYQQKF